VHELSGLRELTPHELVCKYDCKSLHLLQLIKWEHENLVGKKCRDFTKKFYNHSKALQEWLAMYENLLLFIVYCLKYI
jgi:hypothetical protein